MAVSRTRTIKNKHAAKNSGIKQSKSARAARAPPEDGVLPDPARRKGTAPKSVPAAADMLKKLKKKKGKTYTAEELGIPKLNMITPAGVTKPRGQKKGKVFVDDRKSMAIIMAIVQAEKSGQVESKITKARQMEEIREARRLEAEDRDRDKHERLEDAKDALRKRRKRKSGGDREADGDSAGVKKLAVAGTNTSGTRAPGRRTAGKRVRFA